jgi:ABC-type nitrate/sulfonate/bicarbonate transport system substrate-binding protein
MQNARLHRFLGTVIAAATILAGSLVGTPARAADKVTVGGVGSVNTLYWPLFIAINKGFFTAENLAIDIVYAQSSAALMQQLAAGSIDITTAGGLVDPVRAAEKGAPIGIVGILVQAPPYALVAKPSIKSIAELKGKTVSIGGPKDITRIWLDRMVKDHGLKDAEMQLVFAGSTGARFAALKAGAVDATLLTAPFSFYARGLGFTDLGSTADVIKDLPFIGIAVNRNWTKTHKPVVKRFLAAMHKAVLWFEDDRNREEAVNIIVKAGRMKPEEVQKSYDEFRKSHVFYDSNALSKAKLGKLVEALRQLGDLRPDFGVDDLIMPDVAPVEN